MCHVKQTGRNNSGTCVAESLIRICSRPRATNFGAAKSIRCPLLHKWKVFFGVGAVIRPILTFLSARTHTGAFLFRSPTPLGFHSGWKLSYVCWPAGKISRRSEWFQPRARSGRRFSTGCWAEFASWIVRPMGQREAEIYVPHFYTAASFLRGNFCSYGAACRLLFSDHPHNFILPNCP